ncbi:calponin homology domain-containing protein DDB_G0272472-like isoform X2 [Cyclopterus lumpus]|uniref:Rab11 family-interacting protein 1 n=1 Tax=Cyclopterus lumpus TaxID=8103 RepID=A0A8C3A0D4_CYCLU|nr:calponin homology domain-containing protein DDB_G0272472-like isoform X2 [Cyclopterus lumpus]
MSLAAQRWCPTSVQVTVQQARGLRIKGKSGTNDAYAVMQVAKEKFQTSVVEKSVAPVWREEAAFELPPLSHQDGGGKERSTLHVHVLHRALVGPDKLLGQAVVNLLQLGEDKTREKIEWFKLLDKNGKADKDRGEVLLDIQFMRNNMTASMFDLSAPGKSRSRLGKFKDKVRGKKKDSDTASDVVPSFTQVLTESDEEGTGDGEVAAGKGDKKKKHKMTSLFSHKSNLQKNMSQSMSVLTAKNFSLSGSQSSGLNVDSSEGKKKFKFLIHKRSNSSDSKDASSGHQKHVATEPSNVCINGSHVYREELPPRASRIGSNFSLASSGHGSMEDVPESSPSVDSLRVVRQYSPWTEEEEEEEELENTKENAGQLRREEEEKLRVEDEMRRKEQEEEKVRRKEELERLSDEKRRQEEEEERRTEEENVKREEEERIRREEEERRRRQEEERVKREQEEYVRLAGHELRLKEQERLIEEERVRKEEEESIRREEQRVHEERRRKEEEMVRRQEKEHEEKRRFQEQERSRKEEEEMIRMSEESAREERRREEERVRVQEEHKLAEEKRLEEEEEKRIEEEIVRKEEEERIRSEEKRVHEERRKEEEMVRRQEKEHEEKRRFEEQERSRKEEEERIRMSAERALEERRRREEEERVRGQEEECKLVEEKRLEEEERRIKEEENERIRREKEMAEEERKRLEEEEMRKIQEEEEMRKMQEEEEMRKIQEEEMRKRREEEEEMMRRREEKHEENRRLEEQERRRREHEEGIKKEEEKKARREKEEYGRLVEGKRKLEEEEGKRIKAEEKIRREEEERLRVEEERRKEEEGVRRQEEEREQLAEEKRMLEEQERRLEKERKQREEMRRQEEEENSRKEKEENERLVVEKMRQQEQVRRRMEEEEKSKRKAEEKAERERKEEEARKLEKEKLKREVEGQKMDNKPKCKAAGKKPAVEIPAEVTSTNPFDEIVSNNPFEEIPDSPGPDRSAATLPTVKQRVQSAASSVGSKPVSSDEKDPINTQRERRPAPQPPGRNQAERLQDGATQQPPQSNKKGKDKGIKTVSVFPQRSVQMIAPLGRSPTEKKNNQSLAQSCATKEASNVLKQGKRTAPARPRSVEEEPSSEHKTALSSDDNISHECGSEAKRVSIVYGLNPFEDGDVENASQEDSTASGNTGSVKWPPVVSQAADKDAASQAKTKSSKAHAPQLPTTMAAAPSTSIHQHTERGHVTDGAGVTVNSGTPLACDSASEAVSPVRVPEAPLQESQPVPVQSAREDAGGTKVGPLTTSRRLQPVKPLDPLEQQSVSVVKGLKDNRSTGIPCEVQVNGTGLKGPYSQLTRGELISLVLKQEKQLSERDTKVSELEKYIDDLIVRVIEEKPSILMSLNSLKKAT